MAACDAAGDVVDDAARVQLDTGTAVRTERRGVGRQREERVGQHREGVDKDRAPDQQLTEAKRAVAPVLDGDEGHEQPQREDSRADHRGDGRVQLVVHGTSRRSHRTDPTASGRTIHSTRATTVGATCPLRSRSSNRPIATVGAIQ